MVLELSRHEILLFINFFFLSLAFLGVYYYAFRLRKELKRSDQLRAEAEKYRDLFNSTSDGVFQTDIEGNFLLINKGGANILGYGDPEEFLRRGLRTVDFYADPDERKDFIKELLQKSEFENFILRAKKRNGDEIYLELTVHLKYNEVEENIIGIEGIFRDVTRRVLLEEELRNYSENLETKIKEKTDEVLALERKRIELEKLASLGEMAATIVHEVRNPLSSIKVGLSTLLKRAELKEKDRICLELATREVTHLERILTDLLNFAKPLEIKFTHQDVNRVLDFSLDQMADDFQKDGVSLKKDFSSNLPMIRMDVDRLYQVFVNILLNAKQAAAKRGTVSICSTYARNEESVRVEIEDDGVGIRKKDLEHIFEPFFSTKNEGTGLGLPIVKKIVDAHGGTVTVDSHFGGGTKVSIVLPVNT